MVMKQGKVWGETHTIIDQAGVHAELLKIKPNRKCSKHRHRHRYNAFHCIKGRLTIRVWKSDYDLVDETVLLDGQSCVVPPGEWHEFESLGEVLALEWYWSESHKNDIERANCGGKVDPTLD
jgi:mannose-6-phosphate isomerase-like protein (cupin superfamily)